VSFQREKFKDCGDKVSNYAAANRTGNNKTMLLFVPTTAIS